MKHVVRLLVVLIIACGIGFAIFKIVENNTPFSLNSYVLSQQDIVSKTDSGIESLNSKFNHESSSFEIFSRNNEIYKSLKSDLNFCENLLNSTSISKNEANEIKENFENIKTNMNNLIDVMNSLSSYLDLPESERSATEIDGREKLVNEKFNAVIVAQINLDNLLLKLTNTKVYADNCFDAGFNLIDCKKILIKSYLKTGNKFDLFESVNLKINKFFENEQKLDEKLEQFIILFNKYSEKDWQDRFDEYFEFNEIVKESNVSIEEFNYMLNYLNLEAYYEKV